MNEKVTLGVDPASKQGSKLTIGIIEEGVEIHSKLTIKIHYISNFVFIV